MKDIRNLIFDMDGVLWRGATPLPKLPQFFAGLDALGINYVFATNNASRTIDQYVEKFAKLGIEIEPWRVLSSAETAGVLLAQQFPTGTRAYIIGSDGLQFALSSRGFDVVQLPEGLDLADGVKLLAQTEDMGVVVVGFTPIATYGHFAAATHFINRGAKFFGSNPDPSFPTEIGAFPGAGALIKLVEVASGVTPTIIGKPFRYIFDDAIGRLKGTSQNTMMIGDRLSTDIEGAVNVGIRSALVLTGISSREDVATSTVQPEFIFADIHALLEALQEVQV